MDTRELVTFAILVLVVVVVAVVGRKMQSVQPPPGAKSAEDPESSHAANTPSTKNENIDAGDTRSPTGRGQRS